MSGRGPCAAECARVLAERTELRPRVQIVLGSGLAGLEDRVQDPVVVPFADLPGFPSTSVAGHRGRFVAGRVADQPVLLQAGRFHFYEGLDAGVVAAPVRTGHAFGVRTVVLTNAAGGIRRDLAPGNLVLIEDHVNLSFRSVLAGPPHPGEPRFPDMSRPYDPELARLALDAALKAGVRLTQGTYGMVLGPQFETPAEIRALRAAGVDMVGMSTAPEATVARALGQQVLAFSLITNWASGLGGSDGDEGGEIGHEDVVAVGEAAGKILGPLLEDLVPALAAD